MLQAVQCVVKFMRGPTYISSEIVAQKDAAFPALTVCPESGGYKEDVLESYGILKNDYNSKGSSLDQG